MKIKCPTCAKLTDYSQENPSRPFCSHRCKLIDLGAWADEKHVIAGDEIKPNHKEEDLDDS